MRRDNTAAALPVHVGRKDRHSKVSTSKGPRDRRVRLSAHTAIEFYDVQDRLGFDQPSKAIDWLIEKAKSAIEALAELPNQNPDATTTEQEQSWYDLDSSPFNFAEQLLNSSSSLSTEVARFQSLNVAWNSDGDQERQGFVFNSLPESLLQPIACDNQFFSQKEPLQSTNPPVSGNGQISKIPFSFQ
ncbi:hypothetical protein UlMin_017001 [Ulmus minor]